MTSACPAAPEPVLALHQVCKSYSGASVINGVSLTVNRGEIFGLLGPNGAGKTTLMKLIAGLSRPDAGSVTLAAAASREARNRFVGLVPQESNLERELTVAEALLVYARLFGVTSPRQRVEAIMRQFDLLPLQAKKVGYLSGGMARRALIARALLPEPQLLLLDEPTVGLDPDVRQEIWRIVRELADAGKTVVMTTHYMEEADALCRRIALLKAGRIAAEGTPESLKQMAGQRADSAMTLEAAFLQLVREEHG